MAGLRVHFVFPAEMVETIDAARGAVSRGGLVRQAVEAFFEDPRDRRKPFEHEWLDWFHALDPAVRAAVEQALGQPLLNVDQPQRPTAESPAPAEQPPSEPPFEPKDVYRGPETEAEWRARTLGQHWPSDREGRIVKIDGILKDATEAMSPVGRSRSSVQAKRDVRPVPKAKP